MKPFLPILIASLFSSYTLLAASNNCHSLGDVQLTDGKELTLDVLGRNPVKAVIQTTESGLYNSPTIQVSNEYAGFECFPKSVQLLTKGETYQCWQVEIDWSPGADVSGCEIKVAHPSWQKASQLYLHMNY